MVVMMAWSWLLIRHICSESAVRRRELYGRDDWAVIIGGQRAAPQDAYVRQRIEDVVELLETYGNYELALVKDEDAPEGLFTTWWEVKAGHAVILEAWPQGVEVDLEITEPSLVEGFQEYAQSIWRTLPADSKNKKKVIERLLSF